MVFMLCGLFLCSKQCPMSDEIAGNRPCPALYRGPICGMRVCLRPRRNQACMFVAATWFCRICMVSVNSSDNALPASPLWQPCQHIQFFLRSQTETQSPGTRPDYSMTASGFQRGLFHAVADAQRFVARGLESSPSIFPARYLRGTIRFHITATSSLRS